MAKVKVGITGTSGTSHPRNEIAYGAVSRLTLSSLTYTKNIYSKREVPAIRSTFGQAWLLACGTFIFKILRR